MQHLLRQITVPSSSRSFILNYEQTSPAVTTWGAMSQCSATAAWLWRRHECHLGQEGLGRRRGLFRQVGPQLRRHPPEAHIEGRPALHQLQSAPALLDPLLACLRQLICPVHPPLKPCVAIRLHASASKIQLWHCTSQCRAHHISKPDERTFQPKPSSHSPQLAIMLS